MNDKKKEDRGRELESSLVQWNNKVKTHIDNLGKWDKEIQEIQDIQNMSDIEILRKYGGKILELLNDHWTNEKYYLPPFHYSPGDSGEILHEELSKILPKINDQRIQNYIQQLSTPAVTILIQHLRKLTELQINTYRHKLRESALGPKCQELKKINPNSRVLIDVANNYSALGTLYFQYLSNYKNRYEVGRYIRKKLAVAFPDEPKYKPRSLAEEREIRKYGRVWEEAYFKDAINCFVEVLKIDPSRKDAATNLLALLNGHPGIRHELLNSCPQELLLQAILVLPDNEDKLNLLKNCLDKKTKLGSHFQQSNNIYSYYKIKIHIRRLEKPCHTVLQRSNISQNWYGSLCGMFSAVFSKKKPGEEQVKLQSLVDESTSSGLGKKNN